MPNPVREKPDWCMVHFKIKPCRDCRKAWEEQKKLFELPKKGWDNDTA